MKHQAAMSTGHSRHNDITVNSPRGMVVSVPACANSSVDQIAHPIKMSRCPARYKHTGVKLGEHNEQILDEIGMGETSKQALRASGAMG